jgi:hypothetical protein
MRRGEGGKHPILGGILSRGGGIDEWRGRVGDVMVKHISLALRKPGSSVIS